MADVFTIDNALLCVVAYVYIICGAGWWYMVRSFATVQQYKKTSIFLCSIWPLLTISFLIQAYFNKGEQ